MKLVLKFKDGAKVVQDFPDDDLTISGNPDLLGLMLEGKKRNGDIEVTNTTTGETFKRKYSDLYSLEIVFAD
ncbi:hypothetical protein [Caldifermentibacillus hisashii]|uniref:hypothetical protein n=1 Tax=Caldifermentibacillus hisashii TaxID=996558 RepID=UPI001C103896|nr:hypothetical protein [Caldifermentibacillus hisashii]MBU5341313.1 hypothetical protein [Caldifermentibacillus hisashii]